MCLPVTLELIKHAALIVELIVMASVVHEIPLTFKTAFVVKKKEKKRKFPFVVDAPALWSAILQVSFKVGFFFVCFFSSCSSNTHFD